MGFNLDCETRESTIATLCEGFNCDESTLSSTLLGLDLEDIYDNQRPDEAVEDYLYNYVVNNINDHKALESTYFSHFTRVIEGTDFNEGILPLGLLEDRLWELLLSLPYDDATLENLKSLQKDGVPEFQYGFKLSEEQQWGPCGMLIKEMGLYADKLNLHNYLKIPEIIEDICRGYESKYKSSITEVISENLIPMTVKFISNERIENGLVASALCYAYNIVRNLPPSSNSNNGFDGEGRAISADSIISLTRET